MKSEEASSDRGTFSVFRAVGFFFSEEFREICARSKRFATSSRDQALKQARRNFKTAVALIRVPESRGGKETLVFTYLRQS